MKYNKDELEKLKEGLAIEQVFELVAELGGEPQMKGDFFVSKTICHNPTGFGSYKLYSHVEKNNKSSLAVHQKCSFQRISEHAVYIDGSVSNSACTLCYEA